MLPSTTDDILFDNLSYKELFRYSRTCKATHQTVSSYIRRKHKLETVLGKYFTTDQIKYFRHLQAMTGMIISGSTALQFFERVLYPESDLDLYVEHRYMSSIALWLASIGYRYCPARTDEVALEQQDLNNNGDSILATQPTLEEALEAEPRHIEVYPITHGQYPCIFFHPSGKGYLNATSVLNFEKGSEFYQHRKIQIIASPCSPVEMVLNFHSTCVMNFITHEKAYSLFPRATFEERRSLMCNFSTASRQKAYAKYGDRGWTILDGAPADDFHNLNSSLSRGPRFVGDPMTWTIPILPKVHDSCPPEDFMEMNSWVLRYDPTLTPFFEFASLISPRLRHCYLVSQEFLNEHIQKTCEEAETAHDDILKSLGVYLDGIFA